WKPGQILLLNGKMLTGRDAAHKRIADMLEKGEKLPVDFTNRVIYYVGPVDPVRDEVVGPAGPTTATRMDKFTRMMLEKTGLISMIGKSERGPVAIEAIKDNKSAYLMAVGGAAYLVSKAIKEAKVVGYEDLGMEAIYEFTVQDMPVTVAVDANGTSVHNTGPKEWQAKIGKIPVTVAYAATSPWHKHPGRGRRPARRPFGNLPGRHRPGDPVALAGVAAQLQQQLAVLDRLHAFRDHLAPEGAGQPEDRLQDRQVLGIFRHPAHEHLVDLEPRRRQALEIGKRRITRPEIIQRERHADGGARLDDARHMGDALERARLQHFQFEAARR